MRTEYDINASRYFDEHFDVTLDELLRPIEAPDPGGVDLRGNGVYRDIQEARRHDDPSLPLGPWARELKRADWGKVGEIAVAALARKSKDLRIAVWLLEAEINRRGFVAIAPCLDLIEALCARFWAHLYPRADGADIEYRTNVIHWANEKLLPVLRLVPLTHSGRELELNWADCEQARRIEQWRGTQGANATESIEGVTALEFAGAMAATPTAWHRATYDMLQRALAAAARLGATMNRLCQEESPSLHGLTGLIEQIQMLVASELHKRGVSPEPEPEADAEPEPEPDNGPARRTHAPLAAADASGVVICDRASAYAALAEAAEYLARQEPHSPVPYLVKRAIAWGNLNTAELYQELFVKYGGQLNIFEMLGVAIENRGENG